MTRRQQYADMMGKHAQRIADERGGVKLRATLRNGGLTGGYGGR